MLVLTRRVGQTVTIGQDIKVMVLGINGNQVRLGVEAPKDIAVHREEIYQRINRELEGGQGAHQFPLHNEGSAKPLLDHVPTITQEFAPWSASKILHPWKSPRHFQRRRRNT